MARRRDVRAAAVVATAMGMVACEMGTPVEPIVAPEESDALAEPSPTDTDGGSGSDDQSPVDGGPYAVPGEIDEAYVESVVDELFVLRGDAFRGAVQARGESALPEEVVDAVEAAHDGPGRRDMLEYLQTMQAAQNLEEVFRDPADMGQERFEVHDLLEVGERCVVAVGFIDMEELSIVEGTTAYFSAVALGRYVDPDALNPTPWKLYDDTPIIGPLSSEVSDIDALTIEDLGPMLDVTCGV